MKFDKSKILTIVTADQAKVGQKGWFSDNLMDLEEQIKSNSPKGVISKIYTMRAPFRFVDEDTTTWNLFYPAPEPTYEERQAEWVKENNVRFGTKVRFTKNFTYCEDGSACCEHKCVKGLEGVVKCTKDDCLTVLVPYFGGWWNVPFTSLEVIKEPTYRPYNDDELNNLVGKTVVFTRDGNKMLVIERHSPTKVRLGYGWIYTAEQLLEWFTLDGEPCGIKEEK